MFAPTYINKHECFTQLQFMKLASWIMDEMILMCSELCVIHKDVNKVLRSIVYIRLTTFNKVGSQFGCLFWCFFMLIFINLTYNLIHNQYQFLLLIKKITRKLETKNLGHQALYKIIVISKFVRFRSSMKVTITWMIYTFFFNMADLFL